MKIKVLLLAAGCSMMAFGAYAQKGVDTGTPFGSGEDSVRCITNIARNGPVRRCLRRHGIADCCMKWAGQRGLNF